MRTIAAMLLMLSLASSTAADINTLNAVNLKRIQHGYSALRPHPVLMAAAERSARMQASRHRMGHVGGMMSGTWEGVGYQSGVDPYGRKFSTCYHFGGNPRAPTTRRGYWAGAAAVSDGRRTYYTLVWAPANWRP